MHGGQAQPTRAILTSYDGPTARTSPRFATEDVSLGVS
jgi:hypothetical protein